MSTLVLDASVVVELILWTPGVGASVADRLANHVRALAAPELIDAEVAQVLRRCELRGDLSPAEASGALDDLIDLPITRYPHRDLIARAYELRHNVTIYDGLYVALAEALDARLLTRDFRLARGVPTSAFVELV